MTLYLELLAVLSAALFAGAALYINAVEHPARMGLETRVAALQWAPSYKRATWLQAPLAVLSLLCGIGVWLLGAGTGWLVAAILIGLVVPFTFIVIMPTNHRLLAPGRNLFQRGDAGAAGAMGAAAWRQNAAQPRERPAVSVACGQDLTGLLPWTPVPIPTQEFR